MPTFAVDFASDYVTTDATVANFPGYDVTDRVLIGPNALIVNSNQIPPDTFVYANVTDNRAFSLSVDTNSGGFLIDFSDNTNQLTLIGGNFGDILRAGTGADTLQGGVGNDSLSGGAGSDALDGGTETDTVSYESSGAGVTVSLSLGANPQVSAGDAAGDTLTSIENLTGSAFADTLSGDGNANVLNGLGGDDILAGLLGDDTYVVDSAGDRVTEAASGGADTVLAVASYALGVGQEIEVLAALDAAGTDEIDLIGNGLANTLNGNAGANVLSGGGGTDLLVGYGGEDTLVGGAGDDTLNGGADADVMRGGLGDDTYIVGPGGDQVLEAAGGGSADRVNASANYVLAAGQEIEILSTTSAAGKGAIDLTGNEFDQTLYGNVGANVLDGAGGTDTLVGYAGDDTYVVDLAGDRVFEAVGGGTDSVNASVDYRLAGGQEIESLGTTNAAGTGAITLIGNGFGQTLTGNAGANVLNGAGGIDQAYGYGGDDTYVVNDTADQVFEAVNAGSDRINAHVTYSLASGQEIEILATTGVTGTGAIDLSGNGFDQTLFGNNGANILDGGAGSDTLTAFAGTDTFAFSTAFGAGNIDHITDFSTVTDTIQLSQALVPDLALGALAQTAFKDFGAPGASVDANDRILYDRASGALYYDSNGSGDGGRVQFAVLDTRPIGLTSAEFVVA